jgi:hypothetical protein
MADDSSPGQADSGPGPIIVPSACTAFAIGWQTGSLLSDTSLYDAAVGEKGTRSELTALQPVEQVKRALDQIRGGLFKLTVHLEAAGFDPIRTDVLEEALQRASGQDQLHQVLTAFDAEVAGSLTAADGRLGKAHDVGRALAETCFAPEDQKSFDRAFGPRIVDIKSWLADLASSFPAHASRAVVLSLRSWEAWAADPRLDDETLDWPRHGAAVRTALRRQGEVWRALLTGEKDGRDMLDAWHYLRAANSLVAEMVSTMWRFARPLSLPLALLFLLLAGGIALLVVAGEFGQIVGAIATVVGALGLTGAGIRARLGQATTQLQTYLWGAELDLAVADAVLIGPEGWGAGLGDVPAIGPVPMAASNLETLQEFRNAVRDDKSRQRKKRIASLLAPEAEFIDASGKSRNGPDEIIRWLLRERDAAIQIAATPESVVAGRPGWLVTCVGDRADACWVREGQIRLWQRFPDINSAREKAGIPPEDAGGG